MKFGSTSVGSSGVEGMSPDVSSRVFWGCSGGKVHFDYLVFRGFPCYLRMRMRLSNN